MGLSGTVRGMPPCPGRPVLDDPVLNVGGKGLTSCSSTSLSNTDSFPDSSMVSSTNMELIDLASSSALTSCDRGSKRVVGDPKEGLGPSE